MPLRTLCADTGAPVSEHENLGVDFVVDDLLHRNKWEKNIYFIAMWAARHTSVNKV